MASQRGSTAGYRQGRVHRPVVIAFMVRCDQREGYRIASAFVRIVSLVVAVALAKYALGTTVGALKRERDSEGTPVPAANEESCSFGTSESWRWQGRAIRSRG